jgi:hypothetical protein
LGEYFVNASGISLAPASKGIAHPSFVNIDLSIVSDFSALSQCHRQSFHFCGEAAAMVSTL